MEMDIELLIKELTRLQKEGVTDVYALDAIEKRVRNVVEVRVDKDNDCLLVVD